MANIQDIITAVTASIDRIELSIPHRYFTRVLNQLRRDCEFKDVVHSNGMIIYLFVRRGKQIRLKTFLHHVITINKRAFIHLSQPDTDTQEYIQTILTDIIPSAAYSQFDAFINQLEVAFDIGTDTLDQLYEVQNFINHHLILKYARSGAVGRYKDTGYRGKDGNIRKGRRGTRCYLKEINNKQVCRLELMLNRDHLKKTDFCVAVASRKECH
jgi:hypothetical protein